MCRGPEASVEVAVRGLAWLKGRGCERWSLRGNGGSDLRGGSGGTEGATFRRWGRQYVLMGGCGAKCGSEVSGPGTWKVKLPFTEKLGASGLREEVGLVRQVQMSVRPLVIYV